MTIERFYSTHRRSSVGIMPDDLPVVHNCGEKLDGGYSVDFFFPLSGDWSYENDDGGQMWITTCPNCHVTIEFVERD